MQVKPRPPKSNTPAQIVARDNFKNANNDYYSYDFPSKDYYNQRGRQLGMTGKNLFSRAKLTNIMPSQIQIPVREVLQAQIITPIESTPTGGYFYFFAQRGVGGPWDVIGYIADNENVLYPTPPPYTGYVKFQIATQNTTPDFFRYGVWCKVKKEDLSEVELIIRVKRTNTGGLTLTISDDGSSFTDENLISLNATNNF